MGRYAELIHVRSQFLETTGVPIEEMDHYLPAFQTAFSEFYPSDKTIPTIHRRHTFSVSQGALARIEDKLLFIWLHDKVHMDREALSQQFGLGRAQTNRWIQRLLPVLHLAFEKLSTTQLLPDHARFLHMLNHCKVEYLIVGGYAVAIHGYLRPILDLDIFISTHAANARKMVQVLEAFGEVSPRALEIFQMPERVIKIGQPPFQVEQFEPNDRRVQLGALPIQLEALTTISAVTFDECYPGRITAVLDGTPVPVIGLDHLKRNKQASIRSKDADDLAHLSQL